GIAGPRPARPRRSAEEPRAVERRSVLPHPRPSASDCCADGLLLALHAYRPRLRGCPGGLSARPLRRGPHGRQPLHGAERVSVREAPRRPARPLCGVLVESARPPGAAPDRRLLHRDGAADSAWRGSLAGDRELSRRDGPADPAERRLVDHRRIPLLLVVA